MGAERDEQFPPQRRRALESRRREISPLGDRSHRRRPQDVQIDPGVSIPSLLPDARIAVLKARPSSRFPNNISVSAAPSIRGPWAPFHVAVNGTNPAPWLLGSPDGKTSQIALAVEDFKIFTAPRWIGAFTRVGEDVAWNTTDYSPSWTEDPFLWRDKRGNWHALAHWMIDIVEKDGAKYPRVGAHMFSRQLEGGWAFKVQEAFSSTVEFTDGAVETFNRRERAKIFFGEDMTPLYLVSGVQAKGAKSSFTLVQPIGERWREYEKNLGF
ncbi:hypothetical protein PMIN04_002404 [Paraphaeosphaeria minitans]